MIRMTWPQYLRGECSIGDLVVKLSRMETELLSILLIRYPRVTGVNELVEMLYPDPDREPDWAYNVMSHLVTSLASKIGSFRIERRRHLGHRLLQHPSDFVS